MPVVQRGAARVQKLAAEALVPGDHELLRNARLDVDLLSAISRSALQSLLSFVGKEKYEITLGEARCKQSARGAEKLFTLRPSDNR